MVSAICLGLLCAVLGLGLDGACLCIGCAFCYMAVAGVLLDLFACIVCWLHMVMGFGLLTFVVCCCVLFGLPL